MPDKRCCPVTSGAIAERVVVVYHVLPSVVRNEQKESMMTKADLVAQIAPDVTGQHLLSGTTPSDHRAFIGAKLGSAVLLVNHVLDVYKRQHKGLAAEDVHDAGKHAVSHDRHVQGNCLLYTSELVNDVVETDVHAFVFGHFLDFRRGTHVEPDDDGEMCIRDICTGASRSSWKRPVHPLRRC